MLQLCVFYISAVIMGQLILPELYIHYLEEISDINMSKGAPEFIAN